MKENDFIVYKGQTLLVEFKDREGYWWCTDDEGNDYYVEEDDVETVLCSVNDLNKQLNKIYDDVNNG